MSLALLFNLNLNNRFLPAIAADAALALDLTDAVNTLTATLPDGGVGADACAAQAQLQAGAAEAGAGGDALAYMFTLIASASDPATPLDLQGGAGAASAGAVEAGAAGVYLTPAAGLHAARAEAGIGGGVAGAQLQLPAQVAAPASLSDAGQSVYVSRLTVVASAAAADARASALSAHAASVNSATGMDASGSGRANLASVGEAASGAAANLAGLQLTAGVGEAWTMQAALTQIVYLQPQAAELGAAQDVAATSANMAAGVAEAGAGSAGYYVYINSAVALAEYSASADAGLGSLAKYAAAAEAGAAGALTYLLTSVYITDYANTLFASYVLRALAAPTPRSPADASTRWLFAPAAVTLQFTQFAHNALATTPDTTRLYAARSGSNMAFCGTYTPLPVNGKRVLKLDISGALAVGDSPLTAAAQVVVSPASTVADPAAADLLTGTAALSRNIVSALVGGAGVVGATYDLVFTVNTANGEVLINYCQFAFVPAIG